MRPLLKNLHVETKLFCLFSLLFGALFIFITPPFQAPDEPNHFLRAYQLSEGTLSGSREGNRAGGNLPRGLREIYSLTRMQAMQNERTSRAQLATLFQESRSLSEVDTGAREFYHFPNTVIYSPVPYLPYSATLAIARSAGLSVIGATYLLRLVSLLISSFIIALCLQQLPSRVRIFASALYLTPMALFIRCSISADVLTNALAVVLLTQTIRLLADRQLARERGFQASTVLAALAMTLSKYAYFMIPLMVPVALLSTSGRMKWLRAMGLSLAVVVALNCAWYLAVRPLSVPLRDDVLVSPIGQLRFIASDPVLFIKTLGTDFTASFAFVTHSFVGKLGWLEVSLPGWLLNILLFTMVLALLTTSKKSSPLELTSPQRRVFGAFVFGGAALIFVLDLLFWERVGATFRDGPQGRYFHPLAPFLCLALRPRLTLAEREHAWFWRWLWLLLFVTLVVATRALVRRYY